MSDFNFLANLPVLIFTFVFFIVFIVFVRGGIILLKARGNEEREERGGRILLTSLYSFLALLIIALVFFLVSYILQRGEVLQPPGTPGEFPSSLAVNFPSPPQFIEVDGYGFSGPGLLKENKFIEAPVLFTILCEKNEEYDIIYIGQTGGDEQLLEHEQYNCWVENCGQSSKNLYLGVFFTPIIVYGPEEREEIKESLRTKINPVCPVEPSG